MKYADEFRDPVAAKGVLAAIERVTNEIGATKAGSAVLSVDFSPDGTKIVSGLGSGTIKVWDGTPPPPQNHISLATADAPCASPPSQHP